MSAAGPTAPETSGRGASASEEQAVHRRLMQFGEAESLATPMWEERDTSVRAVAAHLAALWDVPHALDAEDEIAWRGMGYLIAQGYGLTETAPIVTLSNPFGKARGRVGKPLHGQEIKLSPEGEVLVRGENVTAGYLTGGQVHGVVDAEGWLHTGDLGELDEAGRLRIVGRSKDVIVTAEGLNVYARDVEVVLSRDARVRDAAVVGVRREGGDEVHAVLLLSAEARGDAQDAARDIIASANAQLPAFQRIRGFTAWTGADFPRTAATGKVKKRELIAAIAGAPAGVAAEGLDGALKAMAAGGADTTRLSELGLSSLETVDLVSRLEGELQVVIDETRVRPDMTLGELKALVASPSDAPPPAQLTMPRWRRSSRCATTRCRWFARSITPLCSGCWQTAATTCVGSGPRRSAGSTPCCACSARVGSPSGSLLIGLAGCCVRSDPTRPSPSNASAWPSSSSVMCAASTTSIVRWRLKLRANELG